MKPTPTETEAELARLVDRQLKLLGEDTSRETVTRVLGEFRDKQLAQLHGSTLLIRNKAGLERLIGA